MVTQKKKLSKGGIGETRMNDKKQIEEMEYDISYVDNNGYYYDEDGYQQNAYADCHRIAEELIKKGWVKLPENSIVLSREEYEKTIQDKLNLGIEMGKRQARKETAEEILLDLKPLLEGFVHTDTGENLYIYKCKQFGVK